MNEKEIIEKVKVHMDHWRHDNTRLIGMEEEDTEVISYTIKLCNEANADVLKKSQKLCSDVVAKKDKEIESLKPKYYKTFKGKQKQITEQEYLKARVERSVLQERQAMTEKIKKFIQTLDEWCDNGDILLPWKDRQKVMQELKTLKGGGEG